jgi:hypothetical protein
MRWCSSRARIALGVRHAHLSLVALFAALAGACNTETEPENDAGQGGDDGCDGQGETIDVGMVKQSEGGLYNVVLVDASPAPPRVGENRWTVDVTTSADEPVIDDPATPDFTPVTIDVLMPLHRHDTRKGGVMTNPGVFEFPSFPVTMTGYWEFTVFVEPEGSTDPNERQGALFEICVPAD